MIGFPHINALFFLYLSERTSCFCPPKNPFLFGKKSQGTSSKTAYSAVGSQRSSMKLAWKYIWCPKDLAHSVFPSLEGPMRMRDLGLSVRVS